MTTDPITNLDPAFGFSHTGDEWLEQLRRAETSIAPGRIGEYKITREIGRGGQGVVYQAVQPRTGRAVALKCLPGWHIAGRIARSRFEREIEAICKLSHPGIVTVHEVNLIDDQPIIAMEWVDGQPIDRWAAGPPAQSLDDVLRAFLEVCDAVAHAHRRGVIHRDLKPSNILMDAQNTPRVLDFGLAKFTIPGASEATRQGGFVGTPLYASPEQISEHAAIDTRTDVYSLGVILYQLVCGAVPFKGKSTAEIFDEVRSGKTLPPSSIRAELPQDLDSIVARAMTLEPDGRYGTVDALADDIRRLRAGEPVLAHSAGSWYRFTRAVRRRPWFFGAVAAASITVLSLGIVSGLLALRLSVRGGELSLALSQTQEARVRAERAAEANGAAVSLLQDLLDSVQSVARSRSKQDAIREVLIKACDRLETTTLEHNEEKLVLWTTIAELASQNFYSAELERCVRAGMPLCETMHGKESPESAQWLIYLGLVNESHRDYLIAMTQYARAREMLAKADQKNTETYARATYNLGAMKMRRPETIQEAEPLLQEALQIRRTLEGEGSPLVVRSLAGLGDLMRRKGSFEEAHKYLDLAEQHAVGLDSINPKVLSIPVIRSRIYSDQHKPDEAKRVLEEMLTDLEAHVTPDSPLLTAPLSHLVDIEDNRGNSAAALEYSDRLLPTLGSTNEPARLVDHAMRRGRWLASVHKVEQARQELGEALTLAMGLTPPNPKLVENVKTALSKLREDPPAK